MKSCIICGALLSGENTTWYRQKNYIHKCNDCSRIEKRKQAVHFRKNNPSLANERHTKSRLKSKALNPIKYTATQMRSSALKRANALNLDFNLTSKYIVGISKKTCPILGVEMKYGGGAKSNSSASLDKIIPSKGYVEGNVQVISLLANLMKSSATPDELIKFANWVNSEYAKNL